MNSFSRRKFIETFGIAAGTVLLNNCTSKPLGNDLLQPNKRTNISDIPEIQSARLGLIPSIEVAPLLVAKSKNLFAKYGMTDVELINFPSWSEIRDRTEIGTDLGTGNRGIDGGHFYSPLPELMNEGIHPNQRKVAMYVLMRIHTHGGYISVSKRLKPLGVQLNRAPFLPWHNLVKLFGSPMNCAIAEVGSNHDLWLRYWLTSMNIIPKTNIDVVTIPFEEMASQIKKNNADLLCLDSWHMLQLLETDIAFPAIATGEIWRNYPGEILAMRADWVDKHPIATQALIQGIMEAQIWCDNPANARELNTILSLSFSDGANLVSEPIKIFSQLFKSSPQQKIEALKVNGFKKFPIKYWSNDGISVSYPFKSHDLWFLTKYRKWGLLPNHVEIKETIDAVNREDLWKNAARVIGVPDTNIPLSTSRGIEVFFNGSKFDPNSPEQYLSL
jgi:ABC-type nitrate/sulfonate/bicarbonate transport system substrate-binding protein